MITAKRISGYWIYKFKSKNRTVIITSTKLSLFQIAVMKEILNSE